MCDTDLDLDLEFARGQDEQAPGEQAPGEHEPPADSQYAGVAWG